LFEQQLELKSRVAPFEVHKAADRMSQQFPIQPPGQVEQVPCPDFFYVESLSELSDDGFDDAPSGHHPAEEALWTGLLHIAPFGRSKANIDIPIDD
jgi:hypothetical protein